MNEKFFALPEEKQRTILNAGYRVFSQNSYKKSPMKEISDEAGISKYWLFHYFYNKKGLYLFLWDTCAKVTLEFLQKYGCYEITDLFEAMLRGLKAKMHIMRKYPYMGAFVLKAYYEKDPEVSGAIQESIRTHFSYKASTSLLNMDPEQFAPGLDLEMMYRQMYWASEGYIWEKMCQGEVDVDQMEEDFEQIIAFWNKIFGRKQEEERGEKYERH